MNFFSTDTTSAFISCQREEWCGRERHAKNDNVLEPALFKKTLHTASTIIYCWLLLNYSSATKHMHWENRIPKLIYKIPLMIIRNSASKARSCGRRLKRTPFKWSLGEAYVTQYKTTDITRQCRSSQGKFLKMFQKSSLFPRAEE